jgi:hypothetical protein
VPLRLAAFLSVVLFSSWVAAPVSAAEDVDSRDEGQVTVLVTIHPLDPCVAGQPGCGAEVGGSGAGGLAVTGIPSVDVALGVAVLLIAVGITVVARARALARAHAALTSGNHQSPPRLTDSVSPEA